MKQHKVFVYGTLKAGESNDHLLLGEDLLSCRAILSGYFKMCTFGGFPGIVKGGHVLTNVVGEVYQVSNKALEQMDWLESNGKLYEREKVEVVFESGEREACWVYFCLHPSDKWLDGETLEWSNVHP